MESSMYHTARLADPVKLFTPFNGRTPIEIVT